MFSFVSKELLDDLQRIFPNKLPEQPPELGQLGILIGQQKVVAYLLNQYRIQNPLISTNPKD